MADYNFDKAVDRKGSNSEKWNPDLIGGLCGNREALPFWVADMDVVPCREIQSAMLEEAERGVIGYGNFKRLTSLFSSFVLSRHNWNIDSRKLLYVQGMLHGISMALDLFTKPGDKVLLPLPAYHPFMDIITLAGRVIAPYHLSYENGSFSFDKESFREASSGCSLILFCSPHNPSGLVFSEDDLKYVLSLAKERGQIVFSDEIHADLAHPAYTHIPMGKANEGIGARCITFMAPSKTFNIAGEHCAFAVFSDIEMKNVFEKKQKTLFLSSPGYYIGTMAEAAYEHGLEYNRELTAYLEENAAYIEEYLERNLPELRFSNGGASFVSFIDCSSIYEKVNEDRRKHPELYNGEENVLSHFFGQRAGICMNDGTWFGEDYGAFVRFNYGTSREMVKLALERMTEAVRAL